MDNFIIKKLLTSRTIDYEYLKSKRRSKLALKFLGNAKKHIDNKSKFYDSLEKAFYNYLKAKLQIETVDIEKDKIIKSLIKSGANNSTINEFMEILNNCDMARYSPITNVKMKQDYKLAIDIIEKIDYEIKN